MLIMFLTFRIWLPDGLPLAGSCGLRAWKIISWRSTAACPGYESCGHCEARFEIMIPMFLSILYLHCFG